VLASPIQQVENCSRIPLGGHAVASFLYVPSGGWKRFVNRIPKKFGAIEVMSAFWGQLVKLSLV
jgi:hypothetical protein